MEKKIDSGKGIKLAILFLFGVVCILAVTILVRIGILFASSSFDTKHQFIIRIQQDVSHQTFIISNPDTKTIHVLSLVGKNEDKDGHILIEIPSDAQVHAPLIQTNPISFFQSLPLRFGKYKPQYMTVVDASHLYLFAQSIPQDAITHTTLVTSESANLDTELNVILLDKSFYQEGQSIAISNASNTPGIGSKLAKLLTNIGGNVISITTADTPQAKSNIMYGDKKTYSVQRLERLLHFPLVQSNKTSPLADIVITIGEDSSKTKVF